MQRAESGSVLIATASSNAYWGVVLLTALAVFLVFVRISLVGRHDPAFNEKMLTGTADRPFVYRQLLPTLANLLSPALPERIALKIARRTDLFWGERAFLDLLSGSVYPSQVLIILGLMYLSLVGFAVIVWQLAFEYRYSPWIRYLSPIVLLAGLRAFMQYGYIYDFSALFLFSLALLLLARQQWPAYLLVFALAALNKETAVLLCVPFAMYYYRRLPARQFLTLGAGQVVIYAVIQGYLRLRFQGNPGTALPWGLPQHVEYFRQVSLTAPWLLAAWIAIVAAIGLAIAYGWNQKPLFLRISLAVLPFFVTLFVFWGYEVEVRAMMEVYPIVVFLMLPPSWIRGQRNLTSRVPVETS